MRLIRLLRSLTFRLALFYMALFTTSVAMLLGLVYWVGVRAPLNDVEAAVQREADALSQLYRVQGQAALVAALQRRAATPADRRAYHALIGARGDALTTNLPSWPDAEPGGGWFRFEFESYEGGEEAEHEALARGLSLPDGTWLLIGRDTEDLDEREDLIGGALLWGAGITLALGLAGGLLMTLAVAGRVEAINTTARRVIAGDLSGRVAMRGTGDDFDRLADTLNTMLARIEELVQSVSRVSDSIAHELRTPLTRLHADLEDLSMSPHLTADDRGAAEQALGEAVRMQSTFDALLRIARIETGRHAAAFQHVDLGELLRDAIELYAPEAEAKGHRIQSQIAAGLTVTGDRDLLFQAVSNLLDNAIKFTPQGGKVGVGATRVGQAIRIVVDDDGPGIEAAHRLRVAERFYRAPESAVAPGLGLGLSLVVAVARLHRGELLLDDAGPGLRATLSLPAR